MLRLYDSKLSGNSWKIRILLSHLAIPYERVTLDLLRGDTKTPGFVKLSQFARVPAIELEDGRVLVESSAILLYLSQGSRYLPIDPFEQAQVMSWLSFEQGDLQRPLATCRVYHKRGLAAAMATQIQQLQIEGYAALDKLDRWLSFHSWLVGDNYTIADIAVFGYVSLACEGGFDLSKYTATLSWLRKVEEQPGWVPLQPDL